MTAPKARVLIVDDEALDRGAAKAALLRGSTRAYEFVEAASMREALDLLAAAAEPPFDCVFLDYNLPDGTALDILAAMPRVPDFEHASPPQLTVPVVVVTGSVSEAGGRNIIRAGAHDFIGKAWLTPASLTRAMDHASERHAIEREMRSGEQALRKSERHLRMALSAASAGAWAWDIKANVLDLSPEMYELYGVAPGASFACYEDWERTIHPDDRAAASAAVSDALCGATAEYRAEFRILHPKGIRWLLSLGHVDYAQDATPVRMSGINIDITERRRSEEELQLHREHLLRLVDERTAELAESHRRLMLSERMAALGTLAAGLGHDMGNLLVPIRIRLDSLAEGRVTAAAREDVKALRASAGYLQELANGLRLLALDPQRIRAAESTQLRSWWGDAKGVLKGVLPQSITLSMELPAEDCAVRMSRAALTQAVFNLVQNAGDALRPRGSGSIRIVCHAEAGWVELSVMDDGPGMSEEVRRRCLEPFFTTKTRGVSTGLGLALVYGFVSDAGGTVDLTTSPGHGASFTLRLPRAADGDMGDGTPARIALLDVRDARLRSFVSGELKAMRYTVGDMNDGFHNAHLLVVDDPSRLPNVPETATVVYLGAEVSGGRKNWHVLGERPSFSVLRSVLRNCLQTSE